MNPERSVHSRLRALALLVVLVPLQFAAPLLHAHAFDDPRRQAASGVHVPGLEGLEHDDVRGQVLRERSFPLIEEADLSRRDTAPDQPPLPPAGIIALPTPVRAGSIPAGAEHEPPGPSALPPPSRAPPLRPLA